MLGRYHLLNQILSTNGLKSLVSKLVITLVSTYVTIYSIPWFLLSAQNKIPTHKITDSFSLVFFWSVWKYDGGKDSVLQVSKEDYGACNTAKPIKEYNDGNTKVKLDRPGPFYFISGAKGHCEEGQKLTVVVITPKRRFTGISPAPAPAPMEFEGPAVAPTSSVSALGGGLAAVLGLLAIWAF